MQERRIEMGDTVTPANAGRFAIVRALARGWWLFVLRGVLGVLFGILIFLFPGAGLAVILAFIAAWLLVDGIASLVQAFRGAPGPDAAGHQRSRTWLVVDGALSVLTALVVLFMPGLSAVALVLMVGAWAIVVGGVRIALAWRAGDWLLGLLGALSVLAGIWLVVAPAPGLLALVWIVGLEAIAIGVLFFAFGWRLRRVAHDPHAADVAKA
jgi:uncharacterized membrane protein HdeD (DUF308 family)